MYNKTIYVSKMTIDNNIQYTDNNEIPSNNCPVTCSIGNLRKFFNYAIQEGKVLLAQPKRQSVSCETFLVALSLSLTFYLYLNLYLYLCSCICICIHDGANQVFWSNNYTVCLAVKFFGSTWSHLSRKFLNLVR